MRKLLTLTRRMPWSGSGRGICPQEQARSEHGDATEQQAARYTLAAGVAMFGALGGGARDGRALRPAPAGWALQSPRSRGSARRLDLYAGRQLPVFQYTLKNCKGMTVQILSYGAITQSITVPDKNGNLADVSSASRR